MKASYKLIGSFFDGRHCLDFSQSSLSNNDFAGLHCVTQTEFDTLTKQDNCILLTKLLSVESREELMALAEGSKDKKNLLLAVDLVPTIKSSINSDFYKLRVSQAITALVEEADKAIAIFVTPNQRGFLC